MPRHTNPRVRAKHARAHTRYQRERWIEKRWNRLKSGEKINDRAWHCNYHGFSIGRWGFGLRDEAEIAIAKIVGQNGPEVFVHPETARQLSPELRWELDTGLDRRIQILPDRLSYDGRNWDGELPLSARYPRSSRKRGATAEIEAEMERWDAWDGPYSFWHDKEEGLPEFMRLEEWSHYYWEAWLDGDYDTPEEGVVSS